MDIPEASNRIVIERDKNGWNVSDEGGWFAHASTEELTIPYVRDLLYGGPSSHQGGAASFIERIQRIQSENAEALDLLKKNGD